MTWVLLLPVCQLFAFLVGEPGAARDPDELGVGGELAALLVQSALSIAMLVGLAGILAKAGKRRWRAFVPVLNDLALLDVAGLSKGWLVLLLVPFVGSIALTFVAFHLAPRFDAAAGGLLGLIFLPMVFLPWYGFGPAPYRAPYATRRVAATAS